MRQRKAMSADWLDRMPDSHTRVQGSSLISMDTMKETPITHKLSGMLKPMKRMSVVTVIGMHAKMTCRETD